MKAKEKLDLAIAQITGYKEAKKGSSIEDLFDSMGLTEKEWEKIKNIDCVNCLFNIDEFSLIRDYFYKKQREIKQ